MTLVDRSLPFALPSFLGGRMTKVPEPISTQGPDGAPEVQFTKLDFVQYGLPEYEHRYAAVIDNLFTPADCQRLLDAATAQNEWEPAMINIGFNKQIRDDSYRNSQRIIHDDFELADWIFQKLSPYLAGIAYVPKASRHPYHIRKESGDRGADLTRLNERLRFLQYEPGQFFKPHCDGIYHTLDDLESTYFTLQIYLNGSQDTLKGGATRFLPERFFREKPGSSPKHWVDVEPRPGRVLIFEQRGLVHTGEPVEKGMKISMRSDFLHKAILPASAETEAVPAVDAVAVA